MGVVLDIPFTEYNKLKEEERPNHIIVKILIRGPITDAIAELWLNELCDKLNGFEAANLATARLS